MFIGNGHTTENLLAHVRCECAALCTPASVASGLGLTFAPCRSQPACNLFGLLDILVRGAPEEQASGDASHRDRGVELRSHAQEAVFHGGRAGPLRKGDTGRGVVERLDVSLEGLIELRIHPGAAAYPASFV